MYFHNLLLSSLLLVAPAQVLCAGGKDENPLGPLLPEPAHSYMLKEKSRFQTALTGHVHNIAFGPYELAKRARLYNNYRSDAWIKKNIIGIVERGHFVRDIPVMARSAEEAELQAKGLAKMIDVGLLRGIEWARQLLEVEEKDVQQGKLSQEDYNADKKYVEYMQEQYDKHSRIVYDVYQILPQLHKWFKQFQEPELNFYGIANEYLRVLASTKRSSEWWANWYGRRGDLEFKIWYGIGEDEFKLKKNRVAACLEGGRADQPPTRQGILACAQNKEFLEYFLDHAITKRFEEVVQTALWDECKGKDSSCGRIWAWHDAQKNTFSWMHSPPNVENMRERLLQGRPGSSRHYGVHELLRKGLMMDYAKAKAASAKSMANAGTRARVGPTETEAVWDKWMDQIPSEMKIDFDRLNESK